MPCLFSQERFKKLADPTLCYVLEAVEVAKEGDLEEPDKFVTASRIAPNPQGIKGIQKESITEEFMKKMLAIPPHLVSNCMCLMLFIRNPDVAKKFNFRVEPKQMLANVLGRGKLPLENMKQVYQGLIDDEKEDLVASLRSVKNPPNRVVNFLKWVNQGGDKDRVAF